MLQFLKPVLRIFLVGVAAVLPFVITMMVVIWVSSYLTALLGPNAVLGQLLREWDSWSSAATPWLTLWAG